MGGWFVLFAESAGSLNCRGCGYTIWRYVTGVVCVEPWDLIGRYPGVAYVYTPYLTICPKILMARRFPKE